MPRRGGGGAAGSRVSAACAHPPGAHSHTHHSHTCSAASSAASSVIRYAAPAAAATPASAGGAPSTLLASLNIESEPASLPFDAATLQGFIARLTGTQQQQVDALRGIRKMTCADRNPPIQQVIDSGLVPLVIKFLHGDEPICQFETAWILTNIASGTQQHALSIADAMPRLVELLHSHHPDLQEQTVWAIGNYSGSDCAMRDHALSLGAMAPLLELMDPKLHAPVAPASSTSTGVVPANSHAHAHGHHHHAHSHSHSSRLGVLRVASWAVSNLTRGKPAVDFALVKDSLPVLGALLASCTDEAVLTDSLWACSFLTDDATATSEKLDAVIRVPGLVASIVSFLRHPVFMIQSAAVRCIGNIASGNDTHTQHLLDSQALPALLALLVSPKKSLRKEACWCVSNISAGNAAHVTAVIEAGILPPLIRILEHDTFNLAKEAAWCVSNITTNGSHQQLLMLTRPPLDVVHPLMELFTAEGANDTISQVVLVAVQNLLRAAALPQHPENGPGPKPVTAKGKAKAQARWINPVIAQVHTGGGPRAIHALREGRLPDHPLSKTAADILREFFPNEQLPELRTVDAITHATASAAAISATPASPATVVASSSTPASSSSTPAAISVACASAPASSFTATVAPLSPLLTASC